MKNKHLFFTAILLLSALFVSAEPVDPMRALETAEQFLPKKSQARRIKSKTTPEQSYEIVYTHRMPNSDRAAFYVVKLGEKGFVIISADDVANPILGYSYTNSWPTSISAEGDTILHPQVLSYLNDMALQIETAIEKYPNLESSEEWNNVGQKAVRKTSARKSADALPDSVGPLLTTTWGQGQYYNALCPEDAGGEDGHVPTGCVATAMAQIINYWGQKEEIKTRGIHSYDSQYGNLRVNYDSASYDFTNMPDALTAESTPEQINAVAKLMYECGVAVNMQYSAGESGAYNEDARAALINFYHFTPDLSIAERAYFSNVEWDNLLHNDIAQGKPVYYSGTSNNLGHSFVCDGYNATGYYHFNFGWGGLADGWYLTSAVSPIGMDFNSNQSVLVDIVPDNASNVILGQTTGNSVFKVEEPFEFYHLLGHNAYEGTNYMNECNNHVLFLSADDATQLVLDILEHEDQNATVCDGEWGAELRSLHAGQENDLSPIVSTNNALQINYLGNLYYSGFHFAISRDEGCRRVSNIVTSVDTTTIHLMWQENGNATQWEIEYGEKGFALGSGTRIVTNTKQYDIIGLKKFTEYDIYVRSVCSVNDYGEWSNVSILSLAPYWTDVVTEQPDGYVVSEDYTRVYVSTPEAFAWWAKQVGNIDAYLMADLDMSAYRWKPVYLNRNFFGLGHCISNVYVKETTNYVGLFSNINHSSITDLGLINSYINGLDYTGGLCGESLDGIIQNCYVKNSTIIGHNYTGGLTGANCGAIISNSYVNSYISGMKWSGLFIGELSNSGTLQNCYAAGDFEQRSYCYNGGIVAYANSGIIDNCYSIDVPMGVVGFKGATIISDTSTIKSSSLGYVLETPVMFDEEEITSLLEALNKDVAHKNDSLLRTWTMDNDLTNNGFPIYGVYHTIKCPNVKNISLSNNIINDKHALIIQWEDNGATEWQIRYRLHDIPTDTYTYIATKNNMDTIYDLSLGNVYDFNVRAICDSNLKSGWSSTQNFIVDLPYWTDVVTAQPDGYIVDADGNVRISSAEGLAWLAVVVNGLHSIEPYDFMTKTVTLEKDISLFGYRWKPIGCYTKQTYEWRGFRGVFEGLEHKISELYVCDANSNLGLFGYVQDGQIKNTIISGKVSSILNNENESQSMPSSAIGGIVGYMSGNSKIINCHSSVDVYGVGEIGSLCGSVNSHNADVLPIIINCSSSGSVTGRDICGGLIGYAYGVIVKNCYATGNVYDANNYWHSWHKGGLIGDLAYSSVYNCFSIGSVKIGEDSKGYLGSVIGCPEYDSEIQYLYGQIDTNNGLELIGIDCEDIADTTQFIHNEYSNSLLLPISIAGISHTDLIDALNAWVVEQNDPILKTWVTDSLTGYPILGKPFVPSCYNPTNLSIANATIIGDSTIRTQLSWHQEREPIAWEILYVDTEQQIENGTIIRVNTNPCILSDIPVGRPLDFYVRAICNDDDISSWSEPITYIPDKLRWTEVVTTEPDGYEEDEGGNIFISSAEGLAWLSSKVNGLNGQERNSLDRKRIYLMNDIDLSQYRWMPIGMSYETSTYSVSLCGNNHSIRGLYINDLADNLGLFGYAFEINIFNTQLNECKIFGEVNIGALVGYAHSSTIRNCTVRGQLHGIQCIGGLIGNDSHSTIQNSCFIGDILCRTNVTKFNTISGHIGGIAGGSYESIFANCYVVSEIPDTIAYTGVFSGSSIDVLSNCYYKDYIGHPNLTEFGNLVDNSAFYGTACSWLLKSPPYINGAFQKNLLDALNAWVDANNSEGQYLHWVADTAGVNGGFPIFAEEDTRYIITFCNDDGTILQQDTLELGEMPEYRGGIPTKDSTEQYNYTFIGWDQEVVPVTKDVTYYAQYEETINQYEINFYDWDGTLLQSTMVNYGEMPAYTGIIPTRESNAQYTYTFTGWSPELDWVTGTASYYAQYEATLNQYEVTFLNWDGSVLQSTMVNYGEMPAYKGNTPTRPEDEQYIYTFFGWEPEITFVIENAGYTAVYEAVEKGSSIEDVIVDSIIIKPRKVYVDGNLYIIIGEQIYSCQGHRIK